MCDDGYGGDEEIRKVLLSLGMAVEASDEAAMSALLDDEFVGIGFAGQRVGKDVYVKVHLDPPFKKYVVEPGQILRLGDDGASAEGVQDVVGSFALVARFTASLRRIQGNWKIASWQETGIVDPDAFIAMARVMA